MSPIGGPRRREAVPRGVDRGFSAGVARSDGVPDVPHAPGGPVRVPHRAARILDAGPGGLCGLAAPDRFWFLYGTAVRAGAGGLPGWGDGDPSGFPSRLPVRACPYGRLGISLPAAGPLRDVPVRAAVRPLGRPSSMPRGGLPPISWRGRPMGRMDSMGPCAGCPRRASGPPPHGPGPHRAPPPSATSRDAGESIGWDTVDAVRAVSASRLGCRAACIPAFRVHASACGMAVDCVLGILDVRRLPVPFPACRYRCGGLPGFSRVHPFAVRDHAGTVGRFHGPPGYPAMAAPGGPSPACAPGMDVEAYRVAALEAFRPVYGCSPQGSDPRAAGERMRRGLARSHSTTGGPPATHASRRRLPAPPPRGPHGPGARVRDRRHGGPAGARAPS